MSVVTSIRDYIEIISTQIAAREDPGGFFSVLSESFPHIFKMCKDAVWYLVSFQGLRESFFQPYLGAVNGTADRYSTTFLEANIVSSWMWAGNPEISLKYCLKLFFNGLGNSFFISLPGSIGTLLILRRIILQGVPAGLAATLGAVLGSCSIMAAVTFGSRFLTYSSAFLDVFFFIGLAVPGYVILRGLCFSDFRIIPSKDTKTLVSIGFMHFLTAMSNQSTLFKHIRDLTLDSYPTRFLGIYSNSPRIIYILGFSIGTFIFAFSAFYTVVFGINWWLARSRLTRSRLMKFSENLSIVFLTGTAISTVSYYGTDFLLTKSFGFLPADKGFSETVLDPSSIFKDPHNLTGVHALYPSNEFSLDPAPFDRPLDKACRRSILLKQPFFKYRSFEELNYQGEKHWLHRGFRHGSAKPIKTVTLPAEKAKLSEGRALLRSLDKAIGWVDESKAKQNTPELAFTNLAKESIPFDFGCNPLLLDTNNQYKGADVIDNQLAPTFFSRTPAEKAKLSDGGADLTVLEQKFKRIFFGQIGLLPGRLPPIPYGPFDSQEMAHKRLAFTNPVYKALLSLDIDLFLKRQPSSGSLSVDDEHNIFLKRQLLERYINTQRDYFADQNNYLSGELGLGEAGLLKGATQSPKNQIFLKSLASQTYKHQFKGTLEIVRQMFAVSLDCPEPSSVAGGGSWNKAFIGQTNDGGQNFFKDDKGLVTPRPTNPRVLKFDQPLYSDPSVSSLIKQKNSKSLYKGNTLSYDHEELSKAFDSKNKNLSKGPALLRSSNSKETKPFLESTSISPFYVGWDNERRQLLLTRRYLSRKDALFFNSLTSWQRHDRTFDGSTQHFSSDLTSQASRNNKRQEWVPPNAKVKETSFATWPLVKPDLTDKVTANWRIPSRSFEQMVALEEEARIGLDEPSDKSKGLRGSYEAFVELWNKNFLRDLPQEIPSFKLSRWPSNITTPSIQTDLDSFDQIENSLFVGVKRGGFIWPGGIKPKGLGLTGN